MNRKPGLLPWLIWALAALFVVFNYVQQVVPNIIASELSRAFNATGSTLGNIAACYFYAYAAMQIPVGLIVDRWGARRPLVLAVFAAGLATVAFAGVYSSGHAGIARLVMGASAAFSFIGCLKLVEEWFPVSRFSTLAGMTNTAGMIGAAAGAPVAVLVTSIGWRKSVGLMGAAELILAVLVFLFVRDRLTARSDADRSTAGRPDGILRVARDPRVWINAVYATSISLVFVAFGGLWGAGYIQKVYGLAAVAAAGAGSLLFLGGIAGSLFFGWFSDCLGRRKLPMMLAGAGALATMSGLIYLPGLPLTAFEAGLFMVGFFSSANIISYAVARELHPALAGLSIGFLSTCYFAGSAASQPLVGMLLEYHSGGTAAGGIHSLTAGDYRYAFSPLVAFMLVGLVASLMIRETFERQPAAGPVKETAPADIEPPDLETGM